MKTTMQNKVYKITYGSTTQVTDARKKQVYNADNLNIDSVTVVATDVYDALIKTEKILLATEQRWLKKDEQVFVESVELIVMIDDITK